MRESVFNFLQLCSKDSSELLDRKTMFDDSSVTLGKMYKILDSLTQECLQIMCWSCSLLIKHYLKDQLPGEKYYKPNKEIISGLKHCPKTNTVSERDFATDQKLTQKPNLLE